MSLTIDGLSEFLVENYDLDPEDVDAETLLFSDGLLDSFSMMELISYIEAMEDFRMGAMDVNLQNLDSIGRILRFVSARQGG